MGPGAHAHEGDTGLVAAKVGNVLPHPVEQQPLVPQAQVQRALALGDGRAGEAQGADAVVEVDGDDGGLGPAHEAAHVALGAQAAVEGAAVHVDHDGHPGAAGLVRQGRAVHVEVEAVLAVEHARDARRRARAHGPEGAGVEGGRRGRRGQLQRDGRPEAVLAARGLRKGDAAPGLDGAGHGAAGRQQHALVAALGEVDGRRRARVRRWRAGPGPEWVPALGPWLLLLLLLLLVLLVPGHVQCLAAGCVTGWRAEAVRACRASFATSRAGPQGPMLPTQTQTSRQDPVRGGRGVLLPKERDEADNYNAEDEGQCRETGTVRCYK